MKHRDGEKVAWKCRERDGEKEARKQGSQQHHRQLESPAPKCPNIVAVVVSTRFYPVNQITLAVLRNPVEKENRQLKNKRRKDDGKNKEEESGRRFIIT